MIQCAECGSTDLRKKGIRNGLQRYRCNLCGAWTTGVPSDDASALPDAMQKIMERYTPHELRALARGWGLSQSSLSRPALTFEGEEVCIGFCTDTHIGEESFNDSLWESFINECKRQNVDAILHAGDILEGMSTTIF